MSSTFVILDSSALIAPINVKDLQKFPVKAVLCSGALAFMRDDPPDIKSDDDR